jgi:hypothetical protein
MAVKTPPLDPYLVDVLMRDLTGHDRQPSAFLVYLLLWHRTIGVGAKTVSISHRGIADATGLSKSAVQASLRTLQRRRLVQQERASITATPEYTVLRPWVTRLARRSAKREGA